MSDVIRLLPDSVANQIAAGEVIQRPASVIKELVENSVDAGATDIKIILRDGGKNLIQVIDNGCGMSDTDARLAFERHATSKISQASDLFDLHTMGFRGEALPSIAAVAQIELRTMRRGDTVGTHLEIAASKFLQQSAGACAQGTNLAVKNLFFNFPARRKFLKKDSVELTHILHEFERLALVNPDKSFTLIHNDVTLHQLIPGSLKQRITSLFGKSLDRQLIPVATETSLVKISGFVSSPDNAKKRNALQYFFVNGRNMRHPYFHKAVMHCFENLIAADSQPGYFLNFEVDPATIDVNIHPTKSEIKFENEAPIWQIIVAAIKESLGKFNAVPSIDFDSSDRIDIPVFNPSKISDFGANVKSDYNPFESEQVNSDRNASGRRHTAAQTLSNWEKLYDGFSRDVSPDDFLGGDSSEVSASRLNSGFDSAQSETEADVASGMNLFSDSSLEFSFENGDGNAPAFLQLKDKYIVLPAHGGLMIIDRYRAYVKVMYERFCKNGVLVGTSSQQILFPEVMHLSAAQHMVLTTMTEQLASLGFQIEYLGDYAWSINAIPPELDGKNAAETLLRMIDDVAEETDSDQSLLGHRVALAMARSVAVAPGQPVSNAEIEALLSALFSLPNPVYTPSGHHVFFTLDFSDIRKGLQ